jgi:FixJ family two-component response regulator
MDRFVVVIDHNARALEQSVALLRQAGLKVEGFASARVALDFAATSDTAVIVTEVFMPDMDGIEVLRFIRSGLPQIGVIAIGGSAEGSGSHYLSVMNALGAADILSKPVDPGALVAAVMRVLQKPSAPLSGRGDA